MTYGLTGHLFFLWQSPQAWPLWTFRLFQTPHLATFEVAHSATSFLTCVQVYTWEISVHISLADGEDFASSLKDGQHVASYQM